MGNRHENGQSADGDGGLEPGNDAARISTIVPDFPGSVNPQFPPYSIMTTKHGGKICWTIQDVIATIFNELESLGLDLSDETLDQIAASVWQKMAGASCAPRRLRAWLDRLELAAGEVGQ